MTMSPNMFLLKNHPPPEALLEVSYQKNHPSNAKELKAKTLPMTANQITCPRSGKRYRILHKFSESFPKNFPEHPFGRDLFFLPTKKKIRTGHTAVKGVGHFNESKIFHPPWNWHLLHWHLLRLPRQL